MRNVIALALLALLSACTPAALPATPAPQSHVVKPMDGAGGPSGGPCTAQTCPG